MNARGAKTSRLLGGGGEGTGGGGGPYFFGEGDRVFLGGRDFFEKTICRPAKVGV